MFSKHELKSIQFLTFDRIKRLQEIIKDDPAINVDLKNWHSLYHSVCDALKLPECNCGRICDEATDEEKDSGEVAFMCRHCGLGYPEIDDGEVDRVPIPMRGYDNADTKQKTGEENAAT